ncbi:MAG: FKBP-type peptidyl-prolyl cis-trans isomerase [Gammaproteobacteria bacterium]|nr:FKBP-type peptidyl-prolyl cis-trans isomerase [Gammaproteobacteria bacterium]
MKLRCITVAAMSLLAVQAVAGEAISNQQDKLSYSIGHNIGKDLGKNLKQQDIEVNIELFSKALRDGLTGAKPLMSEEEVKQTMMTFQKERVARQAEAKKAAAGKNLGEGEKFLAENKKKAGIITLDSGLQYKVIQSGKGKTPKLTDTVTTHYRGTLIDGTEFDSSYSRGKPASFQVNGVIKGWTEALQLMKEGDKWQLFIPAGLAYGERGAGGKIGSNSALIFDIELISVDGKS